MARTVKTVDYTLERDELIKNIHNILISNGFKEFNYNGENVYKKGIGFWTATKYIKIDFYQSNVSISGWVRNFGVSENDLDGFVGAIPKATVTKVINDIINIIK